MGEGGECSRCWPPWSKPSDFGARISSETGQDTSQPLEGRPSSPFYPRSRWCFSSVTSYCWNCWRYMDTKGSEHTRIRYWPPDEQGAPGGPGHRSAAVGQYLNYQTLI